LRELERLLSDFPDVVVIWAHGGYAPVFLAERLLERHPNLLYELSARTWPEHPRSADYTILRDGALVWPQWLGLFERMPERFVVLLLLACKVILDELICRLTRDYGIRRRYFLYPQRDMGRLPQSKLWGMAVVSYLPDDHPTRVDPHPKGKANVLLLL
jgi:hypothetical protein